MLIDRESKQYKDIFYTNTQDCKSEGNFLSNIRNSINQEKENNNEKSLDNSNTNINFLHNIFNEKITSFDFEEINNEDLYFINKYLILNKKNESIGSTDSKSKSSSELLLSKKRKNNTKRTKEHSKFEKDNVLRKINIHFISFIVKYVNFNIKYFISKKHPLFTNLNYEFKKNLNNTLFHFQVKIMLYILH